MFRPKREEVARGWRELYEELNLFSSNIRVVELRGMKWVGYTALMGQTRSA
jgi:hypothetical protein